jgi:carbon storage regulator|tara:strand:+ start:416 stop:583 length:168 start_codon:yes stop_codon:yes gene_type:complete
MLVLRRKIGEAIWISPGVTVQVLDIYNSVVKIGVEAPQEVRVLRAELLEEDRPDV